VYDGLLTTGDRFDEPFLYVHNRRRFVHILERGEQYGPSLHLMGFGGDELCAPGPAWLATIVRQAPVTGWKAVRSAAAKHRMPLTRAVRGLVRHRTYADWLRAAAAELDQPKRRELYLGWSTPPLLPGWVTPETLEAVRGELSAAAGPGLADDRGLHHNLAAVYSGAQVARGFLQLAAGQGVRAAAPFFDDKVLEAALSVRITARHQPAAYKPLLVEAMRGIVPDATLRRVTKAETAAAAVLGSRRHRDQIVGAVADSRLARLGLVDADQLRAVVNGPIDVQTAHRRLEPTLGCELWLRNQEESRVQLGG
jgi:asparagine synthase (glutamine-hydrolysing)